MRAALFFGIVAAESELNVAADSPLAALESQLSMVEQSVKAAGRVTPGVYQTVKKMKSMIEQIIEPAIKDAHAADHSLVTITHAEILGCDKAYRAWVDKDIAAGWAILNKTKTEWVSCVGSVEQLKKKYTKCLEERDLLVRHNNTICCHEFSMCSAVGDCETVKLDQAHVGCDYRTKSHAECFAHAQKLISSLEGYFKKQDERFEQLRAQCAKFRSVTKGKIAECAYLREAVNSKVSEANKIANDVNNGAARLKKDCKNRCVEYNKCRAKTEGQYTKVTGLLPTYSKDGVKGPGCKRQDQWAHGNGCVMNREGDRKQEWVSTQLIKCMLEHYCQGGKFDEKLLAKCKKSIHVCPLVIYYPKWKPQIPCKVPDCGAKCKGCSDCVDRPYYQYETPCQAIKVQGCTSVEKPECPGWCASK